MLPHTEEAEIWRPLVSKLTAAVIAAIIIIGGFTYVVIRLNSALTEARHANLKSLNAASSAQHAIDCINNLLGERAELSAEDNADHVAFADLLRMGVIQSRATQRDHGAILAAFGLDIPVGQVPTSKQIVAGIADYAIDLTAHQAARDQTPLGKC